MAFIVKRRPASKLVARPQNLETFFGREISLHNNEKKTNYQREQSGGILIVE
jgi:hypothetical protein